MDKNVFFEAPSVFSLPVEVVDRYLNAPETELKLILLLARNGNTSYQTEQLLTLLGINEKRLEDALTYWVKAGLLFRIGARYTFSRPRVEAGNFAVFTPDTVARRLEEDEGLKYLYHITEEALRRPLNETDTSLLLSLTDWCGLPADVAALLVRYGVSNGMSLRAIGKIGVSWADEGITSFEQADEWIQKKEEKKSTVNRTANQLGILGNRAVTEKEAEAFLRWSEEYGYGPDMISAAYEACVKNTGKYTYVYMDKVLLSWKEAGYTKPEEIKEETPKTTRKKTKEKLEAHPEQTDTSRMGWAILTGGDSENDEK